MVLAHEVLVRGARDAAAEIWRNAVAERTSPIADEHLKRFQRLCKKYGMQLPSVAERLSERFVRSLEIDQLCALLRPAIEEIRGGRQPEKLQQLESHIARFHQKNRPALASSCPVGSKRWSRRWSRCNGKRRKKMNCSSTR